MFVVETTALTSDVNILLSSGGRSAQTMHPPSKLTESSPLQCWLAPEVTAVAFELYAPYKHPTQFTPKKSFSGLAKLPVQKFY